MIRAKTILNFWFLATCLSVSDLKLNVANGRKMCKQAVNLGACIELQAKNMCTDHQLVYFAPF